MWTENDESMNFSPAACFFIGLGVGAAAAILLAPASGSETRQKISESVNTGKQWVTDKSRAAADQVSQRAQEVADRGREVVDRGREYVSAGKEQLSAAVDAGKQAYRETVSRSEYQPNRG